MACPEGLLVHGNTCLLPKTPTYRGITAYTTHECRQSHTSGSTMTPRCPRYRRPHLDPPEKGRKAWLCRAEPGANRDGSNTCRESTRARAGGVKLLAPIHQGTRIPEGEQGRRWSGESIPSPPSMVIIPLVSDTPSGCGEAHKRRGRVGFLWGREEREKTDGIHGNRGNVHKRPGSHPPSL